MRHGSLGLFNAEHQQSDRDERGNHSPGEDRPDIAREHQHEPQRHERPQERAHGVDALPNAIGDAADGRRRDVGNQRITRRAPNALPDAIGKACAEHVQRG